MPRKMLLAIASIALLSSTGLALAANDGFVLFGGKEKTGALPEHQFVAPVTSPYFHEDSFVTTDIRAWYVYHKFDADSVIDGGDAQVAAVQVRLAITDQLQLVAYKDGYTDFDSGLVESHGWNDLAAGLKWAFIQDWKNQFHLAAGVGYEMPVGDTEVFQNDEEMRLWLSLNKGFGALHLGGTFNYHIALNDDDDDAMGNCDMISWNLHGDYYINKYVSPVIELSGFHTVDGDDDASPFMGIDVANFGGGADVVTIGAGVEIRPVERIGIRTAFELPLTDDDDDLYGWRITTSVMFRF